MKDNHVIPISGHITAAKFVAQKLQNGEHPDAALISAGNTFDARLETYQCAAVASQGRRLFNLLKLAAEGPAVLCFRTVSSD